MVPIVDAKPHITHNQLAGRPEGDAGHETAQYQELRREDATVRDVYRPVPPFIVKEWRK